MQTTLTKETRSISSLVIDYNQRVRDWQPTVGRNGVTKIEAYDENGQMAHVAWFAIHVTDKDLDEIVWRVNGQYVVEVGYGQ